MKTRLPLLAATGIGTVLVILVVGFIVVSSQVNSNTDEIGQQNDQIATALNKGCVQNNQSRRQTVEFMLTLAQNNLALITPDTPPEEVAVRRSFNQQYTSLANSVAEPYREVSLHPSSNDPLEVSQVDCNAQYPLP